MVPVLYCLIPNSYFLIPFPSINFRSPSPTPPLVKCESPSPALRAPSPIKGEGSE